VPPPTNNCKNQVSFSIHANKLNTHVQENLEFHYAELNKKYSRETESLETPVQTTTNRCKKIYQKIVLQSLEIRVLADLQKIASLCCKPSINHPRTYNNQTKPYYIIMTKSVSY
jgi:hypothetical protein